MFNLSILGMESTWVLVLSFGVFPEIEYMSFCSFTFPRANICFFMPKLLIQRSKDFSLSSLSSASASEKVILIKTSNQIHTSVKCVQKVTYNDSLKSVLADV